MQLLLTGRKRLPGFEGEWSAMHLGDIASMCSGGTPRSEVTEYFGDEFIWISISDMSASGKYISASERMLSKAGFQNCSIKLFPLGTVLFAMYASIGECAIAAAECCSSQAILGVEALDGVLNEYIYYFLLNERESLKRLSQASSQPNLNKKIVQSIPINLPSIAEQNAIVRILSMADQEIELLQNNVNQERQKKKTLIQMLLTGIVRAN